MAKVARPRVPGRMILECDYGADPLWGVTPDGETFMVELDPLPVSAELKMDLLTWAKTFEEITWPPDTGRSIDPEAWHGFVADGRALADRLQRELGNDIKVELGHAEA